MEAQEPVFPLGLTEPSCRYVGDRQFCDTLCDKCLCNCCGEYPRMNFHMGKWTTSKAGKHMNELQTISDVSENYKSLRRNSKVLKIGRCESAQHGRAMKCRILNVRVSWQFEVVRTVLCAPETCELKCRSSTEFKEG